MPQPGGNIRHHSHTRGTAAIDTMDSNLYEDDVLAALAQLERRGRPAAPIAFYGSEAMGISAKNVTVHVAIAAWPWGASS